jgi:hypothetical protein
MQTTTTTQSCASCRNWKDQSQNQGECHRHAPQLIVLEIDSKNTIESRFPATSAGDWCGDYQAK